MDKMSDSKCVEVLLPAAVKCDELGAGCAVIYQTGNNPRPVAVPLLESLNNGAVLGGSQNNVCNGSITSPHQLVRKVPNNSSPNGCRKPMVTLSHLPRRPPVDVQFLETSYSVSEGRQRGYKTILKGVNGKFRSGELTAIMGPSGAGKSTLMNILAGYKTSHLSGSVLINGKERNLRRFRKLSCYIMQDDRLLPYITVREAMMVSANLKLGKDTPHAAKRIVVDEIIETLGLVECSNTKTLHLSGGQRKRLSIALELVNNPPVMFFDEPTSGLDSSTCFQLICLLKSLARGGRTIVCTIHQPSARLFEMFDHLYMLAEGQCIYQGRVNGLVPFLASLGYDCPSYHNPADYVMEVACGEHGECVHKLVMAVNHGKCSVWSRDAAHASPITNDILKKEPQIASSSLEQVVSEKSSNNKDNTIVNIPMNGDASNPKQLHAANCTTSLLDSNESVTTLPNRTGFPTSGWQQFWILLKRTFLTIMRDQTLTQLRLVSHVVVGILIGLIYYDIGDEASKVMSNAGCVFFTTMFTMFTAMMPTILTFPTEMAVFIREHLNYWYSLKSFYLAKTIADLPFQVVFTSGYVLVVYYMTSQPMEPYRILMFVSICILTALVAQSLGLLIGAAMSIETGVYLGPITTIPIVLFSGFFVNFDAIPGYLGWLTYVSYVRYGFEGAMSSVYGFDREKLKCSEAYCHFRSPKKFLKEMSMDQAVFWVDAVALFGFFIFLRLVAYVVLRLKLRSIR